MIVSLMVILMTMLSMCGLVMMAMIDELIQNISIFIMKDSLRYDYLSMLMPILILIISLLMSIFIAMLSISMPIMMAMMDELILYISDFYHKG